MGMFDNLLAKNAPEVKEVAPFVPPNVADMSDRELLEGVYLKMAESTYLLKTVMDAASSHPLLKNMIPHAAA